MRAVSLAAPVLLSLAPAFSLEITTGFLIGPKQDPRAFYVRSGSHAPWQKTYSGPEFKRQAQGKLFGVRLCGVLFSKSDNAAAVRNALDMMRTHGLLMAAVDLQGERDGETAFDSDGSLKAPVFERLDHLLRLADQRGMVVSLMLLHPQQDEGLDSPDAILAAARNTTDWLIAKGYRHVILNVAEDWSLPDWNHGSYVSEHLEQIVDAARDRFQVRKTDYALPVAISSAVPLSLSSPLLQTADLLFVQGAGLTIDARKLDRPEVVVAKPLEPAPSSSALVADDSAAAAERTSGWIFCPPSMNLDQYHAVMDRVASLTMVHPPQNHSAGAK